MEIIKLQQGSPEWHAHRRSHFNASDAPAMMGCSPYKTRAELIREYATGLVAEVDEATQRRFDAGHRFEELARPLAEQIIGEELAPLVGASGRYSASFDGLTFVADIGFEHKTLGKRLSEAMHENCTGADLPLDYQVQMEQQAMVSGCERILFMASRWSVDEYSGGEYVPDDYRHCWYTPNPELRARIVAGWAQFEADVAAYVPGPAVAPTPVAKPVASLSVVLDMRAEGRLVSCNIAEYKPAALAYIAEINTDLVTDQDFADAEANARFCRDSAAKLKVAIEQALGQMGDINAAIGAVREIAGAFDSKGLALEKLVKSEKDARREAIVTDAITALRRHVAALNQRLGEPYMPAIPADFGGVVKGKRNLDSMSDAVNTELARAKIAANEVADRIQINMQALVAAGDRASFPDAATLVLKAPDDLRAVIAMRVTEADRKAEAERERIRREEQERANREAREKLIEEERAAQAEIARAARQGQLAEPVAADLGALAAERRAEAVSQIDARQVIGAARAGAPMTGGIVDAELPSGQYHGKGGVLMNADGTRSVFDDVADDGSTITLGQINARLAPIKLDAAGLEALGFQVSRLKAAVHLPAFRFPALCRAVAQHALNAAQPQEA